jgi:methylenetetrahydrofolate reductase (NADPH)
VFQAIKDEKKINAGAQFFQTNLIFEPDKLDTWLEQLDKRNLLDKVFILAGVAPVKSYKLALYLHTRVPGVKIPENVLKRLDRAGEKAPEEGIRIALETIDGIKGRKGINGIHLMTLGWDSVVERIVREAGLATVS